MMGDTYPAKPRQFGTRESPWRAKAREVLAPFRHKNLAGEDTGLIILGVDRIPLLEQAIADALEEAHNEGVGGGMMEWLNDVALDAYRVSQNGDLSRCGDPRRHGAGGGRS